MRILLFPAAVILLAACAAVGPDYVAPETALPTAWHNELTGGENPPASDPQSMARWWGILNDSVLSQIEEQAVSGSLDLRQAAARVREARARRGAGRAARFPTLDLSAAATRGRSSESIGDGQVRDSFNAGFDAGWELDLFGGVRRSIEAVEADLQASLADFNAVMVSLTAEVGLNYVEARTFQARLAVAEANLASQQETFDLIKSRYAVGLSNELALQQALYNLESTRSRIPDLRTGLEAAFNRLAILTGQMPGRLHELLGHVRPIPEIPPAIAVGVPAEMLRRRPDIRKTEHELVAQTARIGVAVAELYPKLRLSGSIGLESLEEADFFKSAARFLSFGPRITWNLFDAGAIRNNIKVQEALQEQALIAYHASVLSAVEEVENALTAYAQERLRRDRLTTAVEAARLAEKLSRDQYTSGLIDFSNVLDAQRSLLSLQDQLAQSHSTEASNLVRLYKALGGGWQSLNTADEK